MLKESGKAQNEEPLSAAFPSLCHVSFTHMNPMHLRDDYLAVPY